MKRSARKGIALMITLFFITAISVVVGISLKLMQEGNKTSGEGRYLVQSSALTEDVLALLKSSKAMKIEDAVALDMLLSGASVIPFEAEGVQVLIEMKSAMGRININTLSGSEIFKRNLEEYLMRYNVQDSGYLTNLLLDCMEGEKATYRSDIFEYMPNLYRRGIVNVRHLEKILGHYVTMRHDVSVRTVPWDALIRYDDNTSVGIDANYVSAELWRLLLPALAEEQAAELAEHVLVYEDAESLGLTDDMLKKLDAFSVSYFEPKVHVSITVTENNETARIAFVYNLKTKTAKEFAYAI